MVTPSILLSRRRTKLNSREIFCSPRTRLMRQCSSYRKAKTKRENERVFQGCDKGASHARRALGEETSIPWLRLVKSAWCSSWTRDHSTSKAKKDLKKLEGWSTPNIIGIIGWSVTPLKNVPYSRSIMQSLKDGTMILDLDYAINTNHISH